MQLLKQRLFLFIFLIVSLSPAHALEPLPAKDVFSYSVKLIDGNTALLNINVKAGYFVYRERIQLINLSEDQIQLGPARLPTGELKKDDVFGDYHLLQGDISIPLAILGLKSGSAVIQVNYQGCSHTGFCYPPAQFNLALTINNALELSAITIKTADTQTKSKQASANWTLAHDNLFWIVISFLGFGLLLTFTPCVLPMIPVLSSIIIKHKPPVSTRKAFLLSLTYVLSMSATYALAGILVALMGQNLQTAFQQPWLIMLFSLVFVLLSLSMFGFYELRMPEKLEAYIARISRHQEHGAYLGVAIMGCLATLLLSPCVTAPLVGALGYIAQTGDAVIGGIALFAMGLGMGLPLLLIGTSAGKLIPKAGHWMNAVKAFFGVMLLAVAIYLLDRILPGQVILVLWASLLIITAIYTKNIATRFWQGIAIIMLVYGILLIIGASMGNTNPFRPLEGLSLNQAINQSIDQSKPSQTLSNNPINSIKTVPQLQTALQEAKQAKQAVLIDFYADWCIACKSMERNVLSLSELRDALSAYRIIKLDVTQNNADDRALLAYLDAIAPPTFIFIDRQGNEVADTRIIGKVSTKEFLKSIKMTTNASITS